MIENIDPVISVKTETRDRDAIGEQYKNREKQDQGQIIR